MSVIDAAEYAGLAAEKWEASRQRGRAMERFSDIEERLRTDKTAELVFLLAASIRQKRAKHLVGFCMFRRTWTHNLFVDYLGANPSSLRPGGRPAKGVGVGLLYTVMAIGHELSAGRVMLEATDGSYGFYRHVFRLMEVSDLCSLSAAEQWHYMEKTRATWNRSGVKGGGADGAIDLDPGNL